MPKKYIPKQYDPKKCVICGTEFIPEKSNSVCCSDNCKRKHQRQQQKSWHTPPEIKPKKCIICGKEFAPRNRKQICCSGQCGEIRGKELDKMRHSKEYRSHKTIQKKNRVLEQREHMKNKEEQCKKSTSIADVAVRARKLGMTYGQYVARYRV